jgi:hypothetical protein
MCGGCPTAGTWSSSRWRPDNEFETDRSPVLRRPTTPNTRCPQPGDCRSQSRSRRHRQNGSDRTTAYDGAWCRTVDVGAICRRAGRHQPIQQCAHGGVVSGPRAWRALQWRTTTTDRHHESRSDRAALVLGAGCVGGAPRAAERSHAAMGRRGREATRQTGRRPRARAETGWHAVRHLERRDRVRAAPIRRGLITHGASGGDSCPQTEIARVAARAGRPRKNDCDPSTDFNLCAFEREYSIEAARFPNRVRPSSSRVPRSCAMLAHRARQSRDLRLTEWPLHTRPHV